MRYRKVNPMGAHESTHKSHEKTSPAGIGTRDRRPIVNSDRTNIEHRNVLVVGSNQTHRINAPSTTHHSPLVGSGSHEDVTDIIGSRGRVSYRKPVQKARDIGGKHYKFPQDAIVNSMMKVQNILAGTPIVPIMPISGKQMLLSAAKAESSQASCSKTMRRSISERVVTTSGSRPNNRIRDQMRKEKLMNEQLRTNRDQRCGLRTQSFILPGALHVIPEQPEEESNDPETYSYSDINVYF
eukprot:XP_011680434.1 PREDICTED: uncharacterized protein LOC105445949 isoform X2 [Strongylocentrotus purpuratus]